MTNKKTHKKPQKSLYQYKQQQQSRKLQSNPDKNAERTLRFLKDAIETKDKTRVKELLDQKSELNPTELGRCLWSALRIDELEIAFMLVEAGANLEVSNPSSRVRFTFLHDVVTHRDPRHQRLAILMMDRGADVNARDQIDRSVICRAIEEQATLGMIEELLKRGAKVDGFLVYPAIRHSSATRLLPLLLCSETLDAGTTKREFVAHALRCLSCMVGDERQMLPIVKVLLEMKLHVEEIDEDGLILQSAIDGEKVKMVQLLIEYGFDVNKPALGAMMPLYTASRSQKSTITEMLIQAGADVNGRAADIRVLDGRFALHAACRSGSVANIRTLLRHGADVNLTDSFRLTPMSMIKYSGHASDAHQLVVKYLAISVSKGRKINRVDSKIIEDNLSMREYYTQCLNELERMKVNRIFGNVSFFSFFEKSVNELAFLTRSNNFLKNYEGVQWKDDFPIYREEMDFVFKNAVTRRELLRDKEEALCELLEMTLPYIPLEKIVYNFYLSD